MVPACVFVNVREDAPPVSELAPKARSGRLPNSVKNVMAISTPPLAQAVVDVVVAPVTVMATVTSRMVLSASRADSTDVTTLDSEYEVPLAMPTGSVVVIVVPLALLTV